LRAIEADFATLTDEIIAYLAKTLQRTQLDRSTLLTLTAQLLSQSRITFESLVNRQSLLSFANGQRVEMEIDEAFGRISTRLTLRLREFSFGLEGEAPQPPTNATTVQPRAEMSSREFRERVIVALYRRAMRDGVQQYSDPKEVCDTAGLKWRAGHLRTVMVDLEQSGLVRLSQTLGGGDDGGMDFRVTQAGIEEAEELIEHNVAYEEQTDVSRASGQVPASDRYVEISDNQRAHLKLEITAFAEALRGSNEIDDEARKIAISEVAVFEASIAAPRVATQLVERFVCYVRDRLLGVLGAGVAAALAERLIATVASIFWP